VYITCVNVAITLGVAGVTGVTPAGKCSTETCVLSALHHSSTVSPGATEVPTKLTVATAYPNSLAFFLAGIKNLVVLSG
jgi:hypothetical protein